MLLDALATHPDHLPDLARACAQAGWHGVVAPAGWMRPDLAESGINVAALCGYPTGAHHGLVKASEARLAVQMGATEVFLCLDPTRGVDVAVAELSTVVEAATPHIPVVAITTPEGLDDVIQACTEANVGALAVQGGVGAECILAESLKPIALGVAEDALEAIEKAGFSRAVYLA